MNSARTRLLVHQNRGSWRAASRIDSRTATVYSEFLRKHLATSRLASRFRNWKKKSPEAFTACWSIVDVVRSVKYRGSFATRVHHKTYSSRHSSVVCKSTFRAYQTFLAIQLTPVSLLDFRCCSADHGIQSPNRCMRRRCARKKGLYYRFNEVCANDFARQKLRRRVLLAAFASYHYGKQLSLVNLKLVRRSRQSIVERVCRKCSSFFAYQIKYLWRWERKYLIRWFWLLFME